MNIIFYTNIFPNLTTNFDPVHITSPFLLIWTNATLFLDKLSKTFINCLLTCYIIFTLFYLYMLNFVELCLVNS